jgi:hypothetical protein
MSIDIATAKLEAFYRAGVDLSNHWHRGLNQGYPFGESFDEWLQGIGLWLEIVKNGWPSRVSVLIYHLRNDETDFAMLVTENEQIVKVWFSRPESQIDPSKLVLVQYVEWGLPSPNIDLNYGEFLKFAITKPEILGRVRADWRANAHQ